MRACCRARGAPLTLARQLPRLAARPLPLRALLPPGDQAALVNIVDAPPDLRPVLSSALLAGLQVDCPRFAFDRPSRLPVDEARQGRKRPRMRPHTRVRDSSAQGALVRLISARRRSARRPTSSARRSPGARRSGTRRRLCRRQVWGLHREPRAGRYGVHIPLSARTRTRPTSYALPRALNALPHTHARHARADGPGPPAALPPARVHRRLAGARHCSSAAFTRPRSLRRPVPPRAQRSSACAWEARQRCRIPMLT
jgi:hypothetical protein